MFPYMEVTFLFYMSCLFLLGHKDLQVLKIAFWAVQKKSACVVQYKHITGYDTHINNGHFFSQDYVANLTYAINRLKCMYIHA